MNLTAVSFEPLSEDTFRPLVFFMDEKMFLPPSMILVQGVFVIDSFGCVYGPEKWYIHMAKLLFEVHRITKQKCVALVSKGAHFSKGSYSGMLDVLRASMAPPSWIMWISMGDDIYPPGSDRIPLQNVVDSMDDVLHKSYQWVPRSFLVCRGSDILWRYGLSIGAISARLYDEKALVMSTTCLTVWMMSGIVAVDVFGQLGSASLDQLSNLFLELAYLGMGACCRSSLVSAKAKLRLLSGWVRSHWRLAVCSLTECKHLLTFGKIVSIVT